MDVLETIGQHYDDRLVQFAKGAQRDPAFLAVNWKGKVPALDTDGSVITENPAIIYFLAGRFPAIALLPASGDPAKATRGLSDLIWCAGTLHPLLHRFCRSAQYVENSEEAEGLRMVALKGLHGAAGKIVAQMGDQPWWYGDAWSAVDSYLNWVLNGASNGGFPLNDYPTLIEHRHRVESRPAYAATLARERAALERDVI